MFTNANVWHTLRCAKLMRLEKTFHKVVCRELAGFKPDPSSFLNFIQIAKVQKSLFSVFF